MKKLLIISCLLLPLLIQAQDFSTLKRQGDSLKYLGEYPAAEAAYNHAIDRVVNFEEKVTNTLWVQVCAAQQFVYVKANSYTDDKTASYINWEYGEDGQQLKTKIKQLVDAGANCIFTYQQPDEISILLIWVSDKQLFIRAYDSRNVYKPLKMNNKAMINLLTHHADELAHQDVNFDQKPTGDARILDFKFYTSTGVWPKKIPDELPNIVSPTQYLYQLLPLLQEQQAIYFKRLKTE